MCIRDRIPTPAVAYLTVLEKADAGIVISASHNPYEHNGIKIFDSRGYKLSDEMEERIEELILSGAPMADKTRGEIGRRFHGMRQMKQLYVCLLYTSGHHQRRPPAAREPRAPAP